MRTVAERGRDASERGNGKRAMSALAAVQNDFAGGEAWLLGALPLPAPNRQGRRIQSARARRPPIIERRKPLVIDRFRAAAREIGNDLWSSTDPEDFADRLDVYANDDDKMKLAGGV